MRKYVQHISKSGEKFLVDSETTISWRIKTPPGSILGLYDLPRSEYRECEGPAEWVDVTGECELFGDDGFHGLSHGRVSRYQSTPWSNGYRLRKVQLQVVEAHTLDRAKQWAFIVEKRESK